jgi:hypothetical protein
MTEEQRKALAFVLGYIDNSESCQAYKWVLGDMLQAARTPAADSSAGASGDAQPAAYKYFTYTGQCGWLEVSKQEYDDSLYQKKCEPIVVAVDSSARDAWISVDERLPDQNQVVLVYRPDAHFLPACDPNIDCRCYFGNGVFNGIHEVTHWHPLPAPPQKPVSDEVKP